MNLFGMMDISSSALKAERVRAEVVASNMANAETTRTEDGGPYRRHHVVFSAEDGNSFGASLLGLGNGSSIASGAPLTNTLINLRRLPRVRRFNERKVMLQECTCLK